MENVINNEKFYVENINKPIVDKNLLYSIHNRTHNLIKFESYSDLKNLHINTDADMYGGDTIFDLKYNLENDAGKII